MKEYLFSCVYTIFLFGFFFQIVEEGDILRWAEERDYLVLPQFLKGKDGNKFGPRGTEPTTEVSYSGLGIPVPISRTR